MAPLTSAAPAFAPVAGALLPRSTFTPSAAVCQPYRRPRAPGAVVATFPQPASELTEEGEENIVILTPDALLEFQADADAQTEVLGGEGAMKNDEGVTVLKAEANAAPVREAVGDDGPVSLANMLEPTSVFHLLTFTSRFLVPSVSMH
jgi:hypothetical protein